MNCPETYTLLLFLYAFASLRETIHMNDSNRTDRKRKPAVFLDRDGTIIEDRGHLSDPADVRFFPGTVTALQKLQTYFDLFIVTHQPGVARGLITIEQVDAINDYVAGFLRDNSIVIHETYACPHDRTDGCSCIKPLPFFLLKAAREYDIDLERSFVIGDHPHDVDLARNAGATGIFVLTGHGDKHREELTDGTVIVPGIKEAVDYILTV